MFIPDSPGRDKREHQDNTNPPPDTDSPEDPASPGPRHRRRRVYRASLERAPAASDTSSHSADHDDHTQQSSTIRRMVAASPNWSPPLPQSSAETPAHGSSDNDNSDDDATTATRSSVEIVTLSELDRISGHISGRDHSSGDSTPPITTDRSSISSYLQSPYSMTPQQYYMYNQEQGIHTQLDYRHTQQQRPGLAPVPSHRYERAMQEQRDSRAADPYARADSRHETAFPSQSQTPAVPPPLSPRSQSRYHRSSFNMGLSNHDAGSEAVSPRRNFNLYTPSVQSSAHTSELAALGIDKYGYNLSDAALTNLSSSSVYWEHSRHASPLMSQAASPLRRPSTNMSFYYANTPPVATTSSRVSALAREYELIARNSSSSTSDDGGGQQGESESLRFSHASSLSSSSPQPRKGKPKRRSSGGKSAIPDHYVEKICGQIEERVRRFSQSSSQASSASASHSDHHHGLPSVHTSKSASSSRPHLASSVTPTRSEPEVGRIEPLTTPLVTRMQPSRLPSFETSVLVSERQQTADTTEYQYVSRPNPTSRAPTTSEPSSTPQTSAPSRESEDALPGDQVEALSTVSTDAAEDAGQADGKRTAAPSRLTVAAAATEQPMSHGDLAGSQDLLPDTQDSVASSKPEEEPLPPLLVQERFQTREEMPDERNVEQDSVLPSHYPPPLPSLSPSPETSAQVKLSPKKAADVLESPAIAYPSRNPVEATWASANEVDRPPIGPLSNMEAGWGELQTADKAKDKDQPAAGYDKERGEGKDRQSVSASMQFPAVGESPLIVMPANKGDWLQTRPADDPAAMRSHQEMVEIQLHHPNVPSPSHNSNSSVQQQEQPRRRPLPPLPTAPSTASYNSPVRPANEHPSQVQSQQDQHPSSSTPLSPEEVKADSPTRPHYEGSRPHSSLLHGPSPLRVSSTSLILGGNVGLEGDLPARQRSSQSPLHDLADSQPTSSAGVDHQVQTSPQHYRQHQASAQLAAPSPELTPQPHRPDDKQESHFTKPGGEELPRRRMSLWRRVFGPRNIDHRKDHQGSDDEKLYPYHTGHLVGSAAVTAALAAGAITTVAATTIGEKVDSGGQGPHHATQQAASSQSGVASTSFQEPSMSYQPQAAKRSFGQKIKSFFAGWFEPMPERFQNNQQQSVPPNHIEGTGGYDNVTMCTSIGTEIQSPTQSMYNELQQQVNDLAQAHGISSQPMSIANAINGGTAAQAQPLPQGPIYQQQQQQQQQQQRLQSSAYYAGNSAVPYPPSPQAMHYQQQQEQGQLPYHQPNNCNTKPPTPQTQTDGQLPQQTMPQINPGAATRVLLGVGAIEFLNKLLGGHKKPTNDGDSESTVVSESAPPPSSPSTDDGSHHKPSFWQRLTGKHKRVQQQQQQTQDLAVYNAQYETPSEAVQPNPYNQLPQEAHAQDTAQHNHQSHSIPAVTESYTQPYSQQPPLPPSSLEPPGLQPYPQDHHNHYPQQQGSEPVHGQSSSFTSELEVYEPYPHHPQPTHGSEKAGFFGRLWAQLKGSSQGRPQVPGSGTHPAEGGDSAQTHYPQPYPAQGQQPIDDSHSQGLGPVPSAHPTTNILGTLAGLIGATSVFKPFSGLFHGNHAGGSQPPHHPPTAGSGNGDGDMPHMWSNLVKLGVPAVMIPQLYRMWRRYRAGQGPARGYYSLVSELVNLNGDHRHAHQRSLPPEYRPCAPPLQFPHLDQRLRQVPPPRFSKPGQYARAPDICDDDQAWRIATEMEQDERTRELNQSMRDIYSEAQHKSTDRGRGLLGKLGLGLWRPNSQRDLEAQPERRRKVSSRPTHEDLSNSSRGGMKVNASDYSSDDDEAVESDPMFAPFSHISRKTIDGIMYRGADPICIPSHPKSRDSMSRSPEPYQYRTGTEWSFAAAAQLATGCPRSVVIEDTVMVKGGLNRRLYLHWEIIRDFFQMCALYMGLVGHAIRSDDTWVAIVLMWVPKLAGFQWNDLAGNDLPFLPVFGVVMLIGVVLWTSLTWKHPRDIDGGLDHVNWAWPSAVAARFRRRVTPWVRNRVVFGVMTTLYLPTVKLAMETLVWDQKFWPVENPYLTSDHPNFSARPAVPGDPRTINLMSPDSFCYTTTMYRDVFNGAYLLIPIAVLVIVMVGIWWPIFVSSQVAKHMPYLPHLGGFAKRLTKPKGVYFFDGEAGADEYFHRHYPPHVRDGKNDEDVKAANHTQALKYRRLLDLDDSPIKFVYEAFYPGFANHYANNMFWKLAAIFITVVFRKDNCWGREKSRRSMDTARQVLIMLYTLLFVYRHHRRRPFFDPTANTSELISRCSQTAISVLSIALYLGNFSSHSHTVVSAIVLVVGTLCLVALLYFLFMSSRLIHRMLVTSRKSLVFSPGILTAGSERDPLLHRLVIERVWQDTWSAILLASRDFRLLPTQALEFSESRARPPYLVGFKGYASERHLENLRICEKTGLKLYYNSVLMERQHPSFETIYNTLLRQYNGPDVYFRPWDTEEEEMTRLAELGIAPGLIRSWFGHIHVVPFPLIATFVWDDAPGVAYSFGDVSKLLKLFKQNMSSEIARRRSVRQQLRALENQVVTLTYDRRSRAKARLQQHLGTKAIPYIRGIVRIKRHTATMWQGIYNFNPGFKCTLDVFETGQLCVTGDNKVTTSANPYSMLAGNDIRAYNHYLLGSTASNTSQGLANALKTGSRSAILGINSSFGMTPHLAHLFSENQALIEARLRDIEAKFRYYREWHTEEFARKREALSPAFQVRVFDPVVSDSRGEPRSISDVHALPPYEVLLRLLSEESSAYIRQLPTDHGPDIEFLYQRLQVITPSNQANRLALPWYLFWDDIYRRYAKTERQLVRYACDFCPLYPGSIAYRPMPRIELEAFLEERGLWVPVSRGSSPFPDSLRGSDGHDRSGSSGGARRWHDSGVSILPGFGLNHTGQPASGFLHSGLLNQLYSWLDRIASSG